MGGGSYFFGWTQGGLWYERPSFTYISYAFVVWATDIFPSFWACCFFFRFKLKSDQHFSEHTISYLWQSLITTLWFTPNGEVCWYSVCAIWIGASFNIIIHMKLTTYNNGFPHFIVILHISSKYFTLNSEVWLECGVNTLDVLLYVSHATPAPRNN